ncbi:hypothetical protein [Micromonospora pattaloongensis]|nr:hypothetical protein [Micromonospora pattaloongensis]
MTVSTNTASVVNFDRGTTPSGVRNAIAEQHAITAVKPLMAATGKVAE